MRFSRLLPLLLFLAAALALAAANPPPPTPASPETQAQLSEAFTRRLQQTSLQPHALTFALFTPELDTAFTTPNDQTAVLWLALRDDDGRKLAGEPGLVLAKRAPAGWQVLLPGDPGWDETLAALPPGYLPLEKSPAPAGLNAAPITPADAPLTGYYLPYPAGTARWMEGSISHFHSIPELGYPSCAYEYCHYAYDFTDVDHFPLVASKAGSVIGSRDSCSDGSTTCTNYIVLFNETDQAYQIYLHLANGTIPDALTPGTNVARGQYLGDSDDTGYSTSQHVHFMVTNSIWMGNSDYYWGNSIDIRFADVPINNGIPRNCYEIRYFDVYDGATQCLGSVADPRNPANDWYVSGNTGSIPPAGTLTRPAAGATVNTGANPVMDVTANITDDARVMAVRLLARVNGQWAEIGPKVTVPLPNGSFDWDVNLCQAGAFNGPLEISVRAWDREGNVISGLGARTIQVDHACPPPSSQLLPAQSFDSTAVLLNWEAVNGGAGLNTFELQWRPDSGTWNPANILTLPGSARSTWFVGQPGETYAFRLRAVDANGQRELWPADDAAETVSAILPTTCTADPSEDGDDTSANPPALALNTVAQRNLCGAGDPDWFKLALPNTKEYFIGAPSLNGGAAVKLTVYAADRVTVLASAQAAAAGQTAALVFAPPAPGTYYILAEPLLPNLMGTEAIYGLYVTESRRLYLPIIAR